MKYLSILMPLLLGAVFLGLGLGLTVGICWGLAWLVHQAFPQVAQVTVFLALLILALLLPGLGGLRLSIVLRSTPDAGKK